MVDFERLSIWPIDKILTARGFVCVECQRREAILITNASLEEAMRNLMRYPPGHRKFQYLLARCIKKAEALRLRGETDGTLQHKNMAPARPLG
jgi:hypothetical protein